MDQLHHEGRNLLDSLSHDVEGSTCQDAVQFAVEKGAHGGGAWEVGVSRVGISPRVSGIEGCGSQC